MIRPRIVPAFREHVPGIVALHEKCLQHYSWACDPHYILWSVSHGHYYVMRHQKQVVAALMLRTERDYVLVCTVAVEPEFRGCGLGKRFIRFARKYARRADLHKLKLDTLSVSGADGFYLAQGFKMTYEGPFRGCLFRSYELKF